MKKTLVALAMAAASLPAFAATVTIDFEGVDSFTAVEDFYNGGAGPNYGVSFTDAVLALTSEVLNPGDTPPFSNAPTPGTVMFADDATATMNVAAGFTGSLGFHYSAQTSALDVVKIYSGLDGTGTLLGLASLSGNAQIGGCSDSPYCNWEPVTLGFQGVARSAVFANANDMGFDNITITPVPEPGTYAMLGLGLGFLGLMSRRRRVARI